MTLEDAFLTSILRAPEDDTPRKIFADWLEERGDPRCHALRAADATPEAGIADPFAHGALHAPHEVLLHAILAYPADDALRLAFATYCARNGDPARAEFIRLQCQLARMEADHPSRAALEARESALLAEHGQAWLYADLGPGGHGFVIDQENLALTQAADDSHLVIPVARRSVAYHRGFIEAAYLAGPDTMACRRLASTPIRALCVGNVGSREDMQVLAAADVLHGLDTLDLGMTAYGPWHDRHFASGEVMHILARGKVQHIRCLRVRETFGEGGVDGAVARPLFSEETNFSCLRALEMNGRLAAVEEASAAFLSRLARAPLARQLEQLVLPAPPADSRYDPKRLASIARKLKNLRHMQIAEMVEDNQEMPPEVTALLKARSAQVVHHRTVQRQPYGKPPAPADGTGKLR